MNDKYKVLEVVGEGSFGRVFKGRSRLTGELVALKLIPKVSKSEADLSGLRNEFKIQQRLSHPNVVKVIESFETENEIVAVTEFVAGGELHKLFDQHKASAHAPHERALPEVRVREIAVDLLKALHYLHRNRVLHRDIKPQNVLLDSEGRAKLCDFGFARNLGLNTHVLTSIKGTPLYMAPELIEERPYDQAADLWSVGCILYELLVGSPPFSTKNIIQLINKVRHDSIKWPLGGMSDVAQSFLQRLLEKDSRKRMGWPELLRHPFVSDHFREELASVPTENSLTTTTTTEPNPLTEELTESRELAKEMQRQDKAKLLPGNSQTLIRMAQKYEAEKKRLQSQADRERHHRLHGRGRRNSDTNLLESGLAGFQHSLQPQQQAPPMYHNPRRRHSDYPGQQDPGSLLPLYVLGQLQYLTPQPPLPVQPSSSSTTFLPSSPAGISERPRELTASVAKPEPLLAPARNSNSNSISLVSKSLECEEWLVFLDEQMEEVLTEPKMLDNQNFVSMIAGPLKNTRATSEVAEKVASLLVLPFVLDNVTPEVRSNILRAFSKVKVVSHLLLALQRSRSRKGQTDSGNNEEEEEGERKMSCLITRLLYQPDFGEDFVREFASNLPEKEDLLTNLLESQDCVLVNDSLAWLNRLLNGRDWQSCQSLLKRLLHDENLMKHVKTLASSKRFEIFQTLQSNRLPISAHA